MSFRLEIPTLETGRLRLRAPRQDDLDAFAAFFAAERTEYIGGPLNRSDSWWSLAGTLGMWAFRGFGMWMVEEKATGVLVGRVGPWEPDAWPEPEIGWSLFEGFEGRGYATEAALEARDWAYRSAGWTTAISLIAPQNAASKAVATRLGAAPEGRFVHPEEGWEAEIWRHPSAAELAA